MTTTPLIRDPIGLDTVELVLLFRPGSLFPSATLKAEPI